MHSMNTGMHLQIIHCLRCFAICAQYCTHIQSCTIKNFCNKFTQRSKCKMLHSNRLIWLARDFSPPQDEPTTGLDPVHRRSGLSLRHSSSKSKAWVGTASRIVKPTVTWESAVTYCICGLLYVKTPGFQKSVFYTKILRFFFYLLFAKEKHILNTKQCEWVCMFVFHFPCFSFTESPAAERCGSSFSPWRANTPSCSPLTAWKRCVNGAPCTSYKYHLLSQKPRTAINHWNLTLF